MGRIRQKIREWLRRYGPPEVASALATLGAAWATMQATHSAVSAALAGTWAGNLAYFGWLLAADMRLAARTRHAAGQSYTWATLGRNLRALAVEFGAAELADSLLIRPLLLYWLPQQLGHFLLGVLLAKLAADVTFYVPAILSYELSKKRLRRF